MNKKEKISLLLLRLSMGCLFFYAGITKILNPEWTASGYLKNAKTFSGLYNWFAMPDQISWVNFLNEWSLLLLGISLLLGLGVRFASVLGAVLMLLFYFPVLNFPYVGKHSFIVDEHIIYIFILVYFVVVRAGRYYGLDALVISYFKDKTSFLKLDKWFS